MCSGTLCTHTCQEGNKMTNWYKGIIFNLKKVIYYLKVQHYWIPFEIFIPSIGIQSNILVTRETIKTRYEKNLPENLVNSEKQKKITKTKHTTIQTVKIRNQNTAHVFLNCCWYPPTWVKLSMSKPINIKTYLLKASYFVIYSNFHYFAFLIQIFVYLRLARFKGM